MAVAHHAPCPWDSPGKNTEVGCHFLLQGIFSTQGSNLCLLHLSIGPQILYLWCYQGSPKRQNYILNGYVLHLIFFIIIFLHLTF